MPRSHFSGSLVRIDEGEELREWCGESRANSGASDDGSREGLDAFKKRVKQFIIVLLLSPLELKQFAQATEDTVVSTFSKKFFGPAETGRLAIGQ